MEGNIVKGTVLMSLKNTLDEMDFEGKKVKIEVPMRIFLDDVAVVDVETSGIHPGYGGLLTLGIYNGGTVEIIQRLKSGDGYHKEFRRSAINYLSEKYGECSLYAYNRTYENRWLDRNDFFEVDPRGSANRKKDDCVSFDDFHYGKGSEVIDSWRSWKSNESEKYIKDIIMHNFNCLMKETSLFLINNAVVQE